MANKVNDTPNLPSPVILSSNQDTTSFLTSLILSLTTEMGAHAQRLNTAMMADGTEAPTAPVVVKEYLKAALPSAVKFKGGQIAVSNDVGGYTIAFSDGTNWLRVQDRAVIS